MTTLNNVFFTLFFFFGFKKRVSKKGEEKREINELLYFWTSVVSCKYVLDTYV